MIADSTEFRGGRGALPFQAGKRRDPRHIHVLFENISDPIEGRAAISVRIVGYAQPERGKPFRFAHGVDEVAAKASGIEESVNRATNDSSVLRMGSLEVIRADSVALDYPEDRAGTCYARHAASVNFVARNGQSRQQMNRADPFGGFLGLKNGLNLKQS